MRTNGFAAACLVAFGVTALASARPVSAQQLQGGPAKGKTDTTKAPVVVPKGPGFSAAIDFGGRGFLKDLTPQQRAGFDMYKSLSSGAVLNDFALHYSPADSFQTFNLTGHKIGERDQSVAFRGTQPGKFDLVLKWDEIPHTFSTDARMLGVRQSPTYFSLQGVPRGDTGQFNPLANGLQSYLAPVRTKWDAVKAGVTLTPTSAWDSKIEYTRTGKAGDRPLGMAFGGPSNNAREILEPLDQTTHDLRLSQSYAQETYQFLVQYNLSRFDNAYSSVTADNPFTATDLATAGSSRGRTALAPNNLAQTVVGTGGLNLPLRTRVNASASYARWTQDAAFIPQTINSAITSPAFQQMPTSLDGKSTTTMLSASMTSRPLTPVTVTARVRSFDFRDEAAHLAIPVIVVNDRSLSPADTAERYPFARHNADLNVRYHIINPLGVDASYGYESMERDPQSRNVARTVERTQKIGADYIPASWLSLRGAVSASKRLGDNYRQLTTSENPASRRYDEADRDRYRTSFIATVTPLDVVSFSGSFEQGRDAYTNSPYGLQSDNSRAVGAEADYSPFSRFTVGAGATWENFDNVIRQQYRSGSTPATLNNLTWVWQDNNTDRVTTTYGNFMAVLVPNSWQAGGTFEWSKAVWHMYTFNPNGTPTGGTTAQNTSATAWDFPVVTQTLQPVSLYLRHEYREDWAFTLRFQSELFSQNDFRTATLPVALGNYMYLGSNILPYNAQMITFTMTYRPGAIRVGRSTL